MRIRVTGGSGFVGSSVIRQLSGSHTVVGLSRRPTPGAHESIQHDRSVPGIAAILADFQTTEFATKVSLLVALTVVCALRPLLDRTFSDWAEREGTAWRPTPWLAPRSLGAVGLSALTPHVLSHSFAKNLANNNVGLEKIAALLGHSSLNTTRIYVTPDARDLERAVEQHES